MSRRGLQAKDLQALADLLRRPHRPAEIFAAIEVSSGEAIGHHLFTIMRFDADRFEVERLHSSNPAAYPLGGRKQKARDAWGEHVLVRQQPFRANTPAEIRAAFKDHETIAALGIGSILNIPVSFDGRCLGTMNLCHEPGWFTDDDERAGLLLGAFLVPTLMT